jgi:hypothetical protein
MEEILKQRTRWGGGGGRYAVLYGVCCSCAWGTSECHSICLDTCRGLGTKIGELIICPIYANLPSELQVRAAMMLPGHLLSGTHA